MHEIHKNVSKVIGQHVPTNQTEQNSFKDEFFFLNELPNTPAVASVASPAVTPDGAPVKASGTNEQSANQMTMQPTDIDKATVSNALRQFRAKLFAARHVASAELTSIVAAPSTMKQVAPRRDGAKRYDLRLLSKPATRDATLFIIAFILLLPLIAEYSFLTPIVRVARNKSNTLNFWASMWNLVTWAALVVSLNFAIITLIILKIKCLKTYT